MRLRILVYGAGVLGCELTHELLRAGNNVTLLARGAWKRTLENEGLLIRHYAQLRTTLDHPTIIETLKPSDTYDIIFVVVQYTQLPAVLEVLGENQSRHIVLVGNNPDAETALRALTNCHHPKELAFGFQGTAGRREAKRVVSMHVGKVGMTVGAIDGQLSDTFQGMLTRAAGNSYRLTWETHMDAWLKCHLAFVLPICYLCYLQNGYLAGANASALKLVIEAAKEGNALLRELGYPLRPDGQEEAFVDGRRKILILLWVMAKTPLGKLAAGDHAMRARAEMAALDAEFEKLRARASSLMPAWDALHLCMEQGDEPSTCHSDAAPAKELRV